MPHEHAPTAELPPEIEAVNNPAILAFEERLQAQALEVGEIAEKQEAIASAGSQLIDEYSIKPTLFEDPGRSFAFTAIAERKSADLPEDGDFVANALALLAYQHSDQLSPAATIINPNEGPGKQAHEDAVHDKYTHPQLSAELSEAINNGNMLDGVKTRLGITADNEQPFSVQVLTVEHGKDGFGMDSMGIDAPMTPWEETPGDTLREKSAFFEKELEAREDINKHKKGLLKRGEQMAAELGHEIARAWVTTREDGSRSICVSMSLAEKLLDPSLTQHSRSYSEDDRARDLAIVEHEYVHTQGGLHIDHDVNFGIAIEERRAEFFSGDKHGYQDVKGLMTDLHTASGVRITDILASRPIGGEQAQVYADLANSLGVRSTLELILTPPQAYVERGQGNELQKAVVARIGGFDGLITHIMERTIAEGHKAELAERITERTKIIKNVADNPQWILDYRRKFDLNAMTDLYEACLKELQVQE